VVQNQKDCDIEQRIKAVRVLKIKVQIRSKARVLYKNVEGELSMKLSGFYINFKLSSSGE